MKENILKELKTAWAGRTCLCFDTLPSTNDLGKEIFKEKNIHGLLITADSQSAGRGRRGRVWQSPKNTTISMSLCLEPEFPAEYAAGLTLVMALAVGEAVREVYETKPQIKWPNDLVLNGKKICGILTELCMKPSGYGVIIGAGINVSTEEFPDEIREIASSLKRETGKVQPRERLIAAVLKYFEAFYEQYVQTKDLTFLKERYENMLANRGREVHVLDPQNPYRGIAKGINSAGNLLVVCEDGTEKEVYSGEVSVRGLYGYV